MPERKPVYSEKEVSEIMQRAAQLQEQEQVSYQPGVTRDELVRIAGELGIESSVLEKALAEHGQGSPHKKSFVLAREEERVLDGEIDPDDFDLLLEGINVRRNQQGSTIVQIGKTLRAQALAGGSIQNVEITSRKGRTRIRVKHFPFLPLFATLYPAFMATVLSTVLLAKAHLALVGLLVGTILAVTALTGMWFWLARGNEGTKALADRIQTTAADLVEKRELPQGSVTSETEAEQLEQRG